MTIAQIKHPSAESFRARARAVVDVESQLARVMDSGPRAVRALSRELDGWGPDTFVAGPADIALAGRRVPAQVRARIDARVEVITRAAHAQRPEPRDVEVMVRPGAIVGRRDVPVSVAGCYVPAGEEHLDWAISAIATARAAGVTVVVAASPPIGLQGMHDSSLYAIHRAGADTILTLGGVAAVATMAFGPFGTRAAEALACRGDRAVRLAGEQLRLRTGMRLVGPHSDVLVVADDTADARVVVATLAGVAGRDPGARMILATTSRRVAGAVMEMVDAACGSQVGTTDARRAWRDNGEIFLCQTRGEVARLCEQLACGRVEVRAKEHAWWREHLDGYELLVLHEGAPAPVTPSTASVAAAGHDQDSGPWVGSFFKTRAFEQHLSACVPHRAAPALIERAGA